MGGGTRKRQLEAECELPPTLSRPFESRNAKHVRGSRLAFVVGGEARQRAALSEWQGILYSGQAVLVFIAI